MATNKKVYGPCSEKQRLVLTDTTTDVIFTGGGLIACSHVKQIL
jgi:hypothetical protein